MTKYTKLRDALATCAPGPHRDTPEQALVRKDNDRWEVPACIVELAAAAAGRFAKTGEGGEGLAELLAERDALRAELDAKVAAPVAEDEPWWGAL